MLVDGAPLFSIERDAEHRAWIALERTRLIAKALKAPKPADGDKQEPTDEDPKFWDCGECGFRGAIR